ncbi:unnamed protein product [Linum trigynum]|uniref:RNase H type-1 domain-containing protein n=1 Tax=Linum trigynum TaxID=586398 RepID=A0AAV2F706_9ROSI
MEEVEIVPRAITYLEEYRLNQLKEVHPQNSDMVETWKRPTQGRMKVNVDVDAGLDEGGVGLGVVMRDHAGSFVLAATKRMKDITDPTMGEALAFEFGLQLVRQHHIASPTVESNCLTVVNSTSGMVEVETEVGIVYRKIKKLLGRSITEACGMCA